MKTAAIIVAAGRGRRAGGGVPKQWRPLLGRPVIAHTLERFGAAGGIDHLVVVIHPDDADQAAGLDAERVEGGATRAASVRAGLEALAGRGFTHVLIHDAARPLVPARVIADVLAALQEHPGAAPGVPVTDALWHVEEGRITGTVPRAGLFRAQTPQGFALPAILAAHRRHGGAAAADDVEIARAAGIEVVLVPGDERNIKITTEADFDRAARLLEEQMQTRTGNGFDVHRFGPGDHVILCGVKIPHERGLAGHSDADVGMHAITDAILGALAEGDIGRHFPPTDPAWKGADSAVFLDHARRLAGARGFRIAHVDCTLICEQPKIGPHAEAMRERLAGILDIGTDAISVKATTSEGLGFTGRREGIAALATATLVRP